MILIANEQETREVLSELRYLGIAVPTTLLSGEYLYLKSKSYWEREIIITLDKNISANVSKNTFISVVKNRVVLIIRNENDYNKATKQCKENGLTIKYNTFDPAFPNLLWDDDCNLGQTSSDGDLVSTYSVIHFLTIIGHYSSSLLEVW